MDGRHGRIGGRGLVAAKCPKIWSWRQPKIPVAQTPFLGGEGRADDGGRRVQQIQQRVQLATDMAAQGRVDLLVPVGVQAAQRCCGPRAPAARPQRQAGGGSRR